MASSTTKRPSKATRKQIAEMEARLKALHAAEKSVKKKLNVLECSIVALPATYQETRLKNWNTLPPPAEYRQQQPSAVRKLPRVHQERIRQARTRQALLALMLVVLLIGFAAWFFHQLQAHHLLD